MDRPYFPVPFADTAAHKDFVHLQSTPVRCGCATVQPFPMHHPPQGATGYRFEAGGVALVHASDLEHGDATLDAVVREHARNADVLIYDSQYTPAEYEHRHGWGHSTWLEATRVARDAGVGRLILFHHDPTHDDRFMDGIVAEARRHFENTDAAREGSVLSL
jgi:ribonuclease BN (tRNA processing enzyme)